MVLRIKAVLIALGYGFLVANCASAPSEAHQPQSSDSSVMIETPATDTPADNLDPTHVVPERPETTEPTTEVPEPPVEVPDVSAPPTEVPAPIEEIVPTTLDAVEQIDANLARLEALEIFEVGQLIVDVPDEAYNCYGPCPGFETAEADAIADAAEKLATLADLAEEAMSQPADIATCDLEAIDANLDALAGLNVIEVGDLLVAEPATNPHCYNLPCQEDIEAAEALTCERAVALESLLTAATDVLGGDDTPEPTPSLEELTEAIDANLARLEALEVFEVGEMIADIPDEAYNCYGPCPGFETAEADATAEAAEKLAILADLAEAAATATSTSGLIANESEVCSDETIDANLQALADLGIVEVGDLLVVQAEYSPNCYVIENPSDTEPCPEDAALAEFQTCHRAAKLSSILDAAEEL